VFCGPIKAMEEIGLIKNLNRKSFFAEMDVDGDQFVSQTEFIRSRPLEC